MTKTYIGIKAVTACPETKDGREGYIVKYSGVHKTWWCPKEAFEKTNRVIDVQPEAVTELMLDEIMEFALERINPSVDDEVAEDATVETEETVETEPIPI